MTAAQLWFSSGKILNEKAYLLPRIRGGQIGRYLLANHSTFGDTNFMLRRGTMCVKFGDTYGLGTRTGKKQANTSMPML